MDGTSKNQNLDDISTNQEERDYRKKIKKEVAENFEKKFGKDIFKPR